LRSVELTFSTTSKAEGPGSTNTRSPLLMCQRNNHNLGLAGAVEYVEGESFKNDLARSIPSRWVASRSFRDPGDGIINGTRECCGAQRAAFVIPSFAHSEVRHEPRDEN
jgi:hypothetical protein